MHYVSSCILSIFRLLSGNLSLVAIHTAKESKSMEELFEYLQNVFRKKQQVFQQRQDAFRQLRQQLMAQRQELHWQRQELRWQYQDLERYRRRSEERRVGKECRSRWS